VEKQKKPLYKKWWFWLAVIVVLPIIFGVIQGMTGSQPAAPPETEVVAAESPANEEAAPVETEAPSAEAAEDPGAQPEAVEPVQPFDPALGKDIDDLTWYGPSPVNNDVTGKWYLARVNGSGEMVDYALSYFLKHFGSDDEVHFLVNFGTGTTTRLNYADGLLFVSTYEYVDGEENDAKVMPSGMLLGSFIIDASTGAIEDVTNAD